MLKQFRYMITVLSKFRDNVSTSLNVGSIQILHIKYLFVIDLFKKILFIKRELESSDYLLENLNEANGTGGND